MVKFAFNPPIALVTHDATTGDPFWLDDNYNTGTSKPDNIGKQIPTYRMISEQQLNEASLTPFGYFIVAISTQLSFKDGWEFVSPDNPEEPPGKQTLSKLKAIDDMVDIKSLAIEAITEAKRYHRSAVGQIIIGPEGEKPDRLYRVTRLPDEWVKYDDEAIITTGGDRVSIPVDRQRGEPIQITPFIPWAKGSRTVTFDKDNFRLCVNRRDPAGNGWYGIPELIAVYRIIKWDQNVLKAYDQVINQRGLGLLDVTIEGLKDETGARNWANKWGNPANYAGLFHSERIQVETKEGMKANYNIADVSQVHRHYTSAGTGYPGERMIGVQTGAITGSQTDRDNMAEIYRTNHDMFDEFIISLYEMIDPEVKGKFKLVFPINSKLDKETEASILGAMNDVVQASLDYMKVSVAEKFLGYEITEEKAEKDMYFTEWLMTREQKLRENYGDLMEPTPEERMESEQEMAEAKGKQQPGKKDEKTAARRNVEKDVLDTLSCIDREVFAGLMLDSGISLNKTNTVLQATHEEGMSKSTMQRYR